MIHFYIQLEDTILVADQRPEGVLIQVIDLFLAMSFTTTVTFEQWNAILVLANGAGEENWPGYDIERLYVIAREALKNCPIEIHPIP